MLEKDLSHKQAIMRNKEHQFYQEEHCQIRKMIIIIIHMSKIDESIKNLKLKKQYVIVFLQRNQN